MGRLDDLRIQRSEIERQHQADVQKRDEWGQSLIADMNKKSDEEVLASETFRHRAAHAVNRAGELAHAARTVAQNKASLNEEKAAQDQAALVEATKQAQIDCDNAVENLLMNSKEEIQEAHNRAKIVKSERAREAAEYQQRMRQLDIDAKARAKEVARRVTDLEFDRLQSFLNNHRSIQEEETRARAKQILESWAEGNRATENTIRALEEKG